MLRNRLVSVLTFNEGILFRTKLFVPDYRYTLNFVDAWSIDEIIVLDITRDKHSSENNFFRVIEDFSKRCFVPIAAGGGIRSKKDVDRYLSLGADKVVLNTQAINNPSFITDVAKSYGSQSVVVSIDVKNTQKNEYKVLKDLGKTETILNPELWAYKAQELGAGEIMITSIDRDGSLLGYDIEITKRVSDKVDIPVLISGGAGNWDHLVEGIIKGGASAVCITNIYHFTETAISSAKKYMDKHGIPVRLS